MPTRQFVIFPAIVAFLSCTSVEKREALPYSVPPTQTRRIVEILDYQGRAEGAELAEWVTLYINEGGAALEGIHEFDTYYVFVAEQSSANLETLLQWAANFSVEQDIPLLVFLRVYRRLTAGLLINPDELYGIFFETMVKRTAALDWPFARKYTETWILARRIPETAEQQERPAGETDSEAPTEDAAGTTLYMYLIVNVIEKTETQNVLRLVMDEIIIDKTSEKTSTRDQIQAINAVKSNFFDGF
ncbi:MAG: hypothetical protein LBF80_04045 [Spirochaetaceae bacterium]|jgi:hypothetical protein|nr:hypothetical protein [Spirochaetaceae bacterium]